MANDCILSNHIATPMRYVCLTCDYDGTIARNGKVAPSTVQALEKLRSSGRKLILATGRQLDDLQTVFPEVSLFDRIVAENGALLYRPASKEQILLAGPPPQPFVDELVRRGVEPLSVGRSVVATWHPHESTVLEVIRLMSLELQIIFNKNAVMVLPSGINKGTGLSAALNELGLSPHNTVGVGDAENDHAFLGLSECGVAVGNALPALKDRADWVTAHSHGAGVEEVIQLLVQNDLEDLSSRLKRHDILVGTAETGESVSLPGYGSRLLIAGPSGSGKSTVVSAIVERLISHNYQVCLLDPEGDYDEFEHLLTLGGPDRIPSSSEILETLSNPSRSLGINLLGVPLADRPTFFQGLLARIQELRFKTGHPHWVVIGSEPQAVIAGFNKGAGGNLQLKPSLQRSPQTGDVLLWLLNEPAGAHLVKVEQGKSQRRRHQRKYASGELGEDRSFYFRGTNGKLNLRAQNMNVFAQIAEGVDEDTWNFHLRHADYSRWLRDTIKDTEIAEIVTTVERDSQLSPAESRKQILEAIRKHYTAPA
jgi:hydroxymethylpyrimidine pyrophosphatase-like HAD family hydrolase/energy-coupling factor transporter ATP-binding protein EcfA2